MFVNTKVLWTKDNTKTLAKLILSLNCLGERFICFLKGTMTTQTCWVFYYSLLIKFNIAWVCSGLQQRNQIKKTSITARTVATTTAAKEDNFANKNVRGMVALYHRISTRRKRVKNIFFFFNCQG